MAIVLGSFIAQVSWSALYVCVSVFYLLQLFLLYPIERTEATRSESSEKGRFDAAKMFRRETWRVGESAFAVLLLLIGTSMLDVSGCPHSPFLKVPKRLPVWVWLGSGAVRAVG